MNTCTHPDTGKLLHAYELDQLDEQDRISFEEHLLQCDHCFNEVVAFDPAAKLLRMDAEVADLTAEAGKTEGGPGRLRSLLESLWPSDRPLLLRPAVAYFAIALLAYPAYRGMQSGDIDPLQSPQTILMSSTRGGSVSQADADKPLALIFRSRSATPTDTFVVTVKDESGAIEYVDSSFTSLSANSLGTVTLEPNALTSGAYELHVSTKSDTTATIFRFDIR